jgi:hypothetical protein
MVAQHALGETDGIGRRHENDLPLDPALGFEGRQALAQVMGRDHAGDLVRMERGLHIDARAGALLTEALDGERKARPGSKRREGNLFCSHERSIWVQAGLGKRRPSSEEPVR